jgi:UDP-3-O-[3-hydroxymyristoyl] glucosamine N-acyltransferase
MKQLTAQQVVETVGGKLIGDANTVINGASSPENAKQNQVTFLGSKKYLPRLEKSQAGLILINEDMEKEIGEGFNYVVCDNVDVAFSQILMFFAPEPITYAPGIHPSAVVDESVKIGQGVYVGANVVIEANSEIGDGTVIGAGSFVGQEVKIGQANQIAPNVTIMHRCVIGHKNIIHSGVVIGADGFGFVPGPQGLVKVAQTGIVQIDSDVEIGANTTIDRARFEKTWIKSNVKIDDQVMVAHNVEIGESTVLVAQSGIAGSAKLGRGVILGGCAGINGHISIGDGVKIAGTSGVAKSVGAGQTVVGTPAEGQREFMYRYSLPKKVKRLTEQIKELKKEIQQLKNK